MTFNDLRDHGPSTPVFTPQSGHTNHMIFRNVPQHLYPPSDAKFGSQSDSHLNHAASSNGSDFTASHSFPDGYSMSMINDANPPLPGLSNNAINQDLNPSVPGTLVGAPERRPQRAPSDSGAPITPQQNAVLSSWNPVQVKEEGYSPYQSMKLDNAPPQETFFPTYELEEGEVTDCTTLSDVGQAMQVENALSSPIMSATTAELESVARVLARELHHWGLGFGDMVTYGLDAVHLKQVFEQEKLPVDNTSLEMTSGKSSDTVVPSLLLSTKQSGSPHQHSSENEQHAIEPPHAAANVLRTVDLHRSSDDSQQIEGSSSVDRKALIALKLAAKGSNLSAALRPSHESHKDSLGTQATLEATRDIPHGSPQGPQTKLDHKRTTNKTKPANEQQVEYEAKRKAQTELAKQRMELLKQSAVVKEDNLVSSTLRTDNGSRQTSQGLATGQQKPDATVVQIEGKHSLFSLSKDNASLGIPGLSLHMDNAAQDSLAHSVDRPSLDETTGMNSNSVDFQVKSVQGKGTFEDKVGNTKDVSGPIHPPLDNDVVIDISSDEDDKNLRHDRSRQDRATKMVLPRPLAQEYFETHSQASRSSMSEEKEGLSLPGQQLSPENNPSGSLETGGGQKVDLKSKEREIDEMNRKIEQLEQIILQKKAKRATELKSSVAAVNLLDVLPSSGNGNGLDESAVSHIAAKASEQVFSDSASPASARSKSFNIAGTSPKERGLLQNRSGSADAPRSLSSGSVHMQGTSPTTYLFNSSHKSRASEIETALSIIQREVSELRRQLDDVKAQEFDLEVEIRKRLQGHELLVQELSRLSRLAHDAAGVETGPNDLVGDSGALSISRPPSANGSMSTHSSMVMDTIAFEGSSESSMDCEERPFTERPKSREPYSTALLISKPTVRSHSPSTSTGTTSEVKVADERVVTSPSEEGEISHPRSHLPESIVQVTRERDSTPLSESHATTDPSDASNTDDLPMQSTSSAAGPRSPVHQTEDNYAADDQNGELPTDYYEPPNDISTINLATDSESQLKQAHAPDPATMLVHDSITSQLGSLDEEGQENSAYAQRPETLPFLDSTARAEVGVAITRQQNVEQDEQDMRNLAFRQEDDNDDYEPPDVGSNAHLPPEGTFLMSSKESSTDKSPALQDIDKSIAPEASNVHFHPYESPFKYLKSYRLHPHFTHDVPSGFQSLTYSHAIRPEIPVCIDELAGRCEDSACSLQHFRDMPVKDDQVLRELASPEGATQQDRELYMQGMRRLILDLRHRNINSLVEIAEAISQYRHSFFVPEQGRSSVSTFLSEGAQL